MEDTLLSILLIGLLILGYLTADHKDAAFFAFFLVFALIVLGINPRQ
jgi:hypothetical protein